MSDSGDELGEFLSLLSHTLLTPLTAILLRCELLLGRSATPDALARGIVSIDHSARAQVAMLDNLVELGRFRAGATELTSSPANLETCLKDVVGRNASAAHEQQVTVTSHVGAGSWTVPGDPVRLGTALHNLVSNAVRLTPAGGRVDITLEESGKGVTIRVTDTGAGLAADAWAGLFVPPTLAERDRSRRRSGLGLGLPVARWIAELHGGSLSGQSDGPSRGASFVIELPRGA